MSDALGTNTAPGFEKHPGYEVAIEPCARQITVEFNGKVIADSNRAFLVLETRHAAVFYFPQADVRMDLARRTDQSTYCPFKGQASYWTLTVGDRTEEDVIWAYEAPYDEVMGLKGYVSFYWDRMDSWTEDGVAVGSPTDPRES